MAEKVVSVKLPKTLIQALEQQRKNHHYLDLSEQLRSIVRRNCLELTNPYTEAINQVKTDIQEQTGTTEKERLIQQILQLLQEGKQ
ncbi:MAG: hypothetical protein OXR66_07400 [Candidatus Woesearchaeota archaeon]|nr:hypothetical protein [Candidatus Woesearchaeota archaeon]